MCPAFSFILPYISAHNHISPFQHIFGILFFRLDQNSLHVFFSNFSENYSHFPHLSAHFPKIAFLRFPPELRLLLHFPRNSHPFFFDRESNTFVYVVNGLPRDCPPPWRPGGGVLVWGCARVGWLCRLATQPSHAPTHRASSRTMAPGWVCGLVMAVGYAKRLPGLTAASHGGSLRVPP